MIPFGGNRVRNGAILGRRQARFSMRVAVVFVLAGLALCGCEPAPTPESAPPPPASAEVPKAPPPPAVVVMPEPRCRPDMVKVDATRHDGGAIEAFCMDRYEAVLVDQEDRRRLSPFYPPDAKAAARVARIWKTRRFEVGGPKAQAMPLPTLPLWQTKEAYEVRAVVRRGATPNGHVSGLQAARACANAGKRLCRFDEWRHACGGEQLGRFPYGDKYVQGRCNVFREAHPAAVLHDDPSRGHSDPRLNRVVVDGRPLLRKTGASPQCASRWGDDAIYDMVGNLDEWLADPNGSFAGGFYARSTRDGCDWRGTRHPVQYADYSTGVRCCADLPAF